MDFPPCSTRISGAELEKDYLAMRPMFLNEPPPFAFVLEALTDLESRINQ
jgi:hypothetical protein